MDIIWNLLTQNGISASELEMIKHAYLLLIMIPIVSTILAILRYVIGVKTISIYVAIIMTFSFIELGFYNQKENWGLGLLYGTLLYFIALISSLLIYSTIRKLRMHYVPKITLVLMAVSISFIVFIVLSRYLDRASLLPQSTFVIVMITTIAEYLTTLYARKNFRYAVDNGIRLFLISILCYIIITWQFLRDILMNYPYLLILVAIFNFYLGRFKGLRLTEYWRFRTILLDQNPDAESNSTSTKK